MDQKRKASPMKNSPYVGRPLRSEQEARRVLDTPPESVAQALARVESMLQTERAKLACSACKQSGADMARIDGLEASIALLKRALLGLNAED